MRVGCRGTVLGLVLVGIVFAPAVTALAGHENAATMPARFPVAAGFGPYVFLFGGLQGAAGAEMPVSDIWRLTVSTGELVQLDVDLPDARAAAAAVTIGEQVYIFGGRNATTTPMDASETDRLHVLRFDVATLTVQTLSASLPWGANPMAAWDGAHVVLAGLCENHSLPSGPSCHIQLYDPATDTVSRSQFEGLKGDRYPGAAPRFSVGWDTIVHNGRVLMLGGASSQYDEDPRQVLSYDSRNDTMEVLPPLTRSIDRPVLALHNERVYFLGGRTWTVDRKGFEDNRMAAYDIATGRMALFKERLPRVAYLHDGVQLGDRAVLLGTGTQRLGIDVVHMSGGGVPEGCSYEPEDAEKCWATPKPTPEPVQHQYKPPPKKEEPAPEPDPVDPCTSYAGPDAPDADEDGEPDMCEEDSPEPAADTPRSPRPGAGHGASSRDVPARAAPHANATAPAENGASALGSGASLAALLGFGLIAQRRSNRRPG